MERRRKLFFPWELYAQDEDQTQTSRIGLEMKCCADGESCIMLKLERMHLWISINRLWCLCTTPVILRLVSFWFGTGRVVIADTLFASLLTCKQLLLFGLFFIGVVKKAIKGYPVQFANQFEASNPHRGDEIVITTTVDNQRKIMSTLLLQPETTYLQDYWVLFQLFGW
jgi:hypothetical protein